MTPAQMAAIHKLAFGSDDAWSETSFDDILQSRFSRLIARPQGFALIRTIAGETELLTLAVHPDYHRRGIARALLEDWLKTEQNSAQTAFLEVAADNAPACALYRAFGFEQISLRRGYYARKGRENADALILSRPLIVR